MFKRSFSIKVNAAANLGSNFSSAVLSIIFVPLYLRYLGIESYGLIGILVSLQAFTSLLDFGLSPTLNRELARLSASDTNEQEMWDIKRTLEVPNHLLAFLIALLLCLASPLIANYWIQPKNLATATVLHALIIIGINIAVQFATNFYLGGLVGLQKQVLISFITIFCSLIRSIGALVTIAFISNTIEAFLIWQGLVSLLQLVLCAFILKRSLPQVGLVGRFSRERLRGVFRFAAGMTGISVVSLILTQNDKVLLSRLLNLEDFGYYSLAVTIATMGIGMCISPIAQAVYPRFAQLVATGDEAALADFYHRSAQSVSVVLIPVVTILVLFSYDILRVWTGNLNLAKSTYILLSLVALGNGLNGIMWLPHYLQLAHGWTRLLFNLGLGLTICIIPFTAYGAFRFGAIGGAVGWVAITLAFVPINIFFMHRRILKGATVKWYVFDVGLPFVVALLTASVGKLLVPVTDSRIQELFLIATVSAFTLVLTALATAATRRILVSVASAAPRFVRQQLASRFSA